MNSPQDILDRALRLHEAGRVAEAAALYRQVLQQQPDHADALQLLGVTEHQQGRHESAIEMITRATALHPQRANYWVNLAEAQRAAKQLAAAEASLRRAIALEPRLPAAHNNLALVLDELDRPAEARPEYETAIRLEPRYLEAHVNLAKHFGRLEQLDWAVAAARNALRLDPRNVDALTVAGRCQATGGELSAGIEQLHAALSMRPDPLAAWQLADALREIGEHAACIQWQRRAMELDPANVQLHGSLLFDLHYAPDIPPQTIAAEHVAWGQRHADPIAHLPGVHVHPSHQRIRLGYVSGDFRGHVVGRFMRPLLRAHDRNVVKIYCYANNAPDAAADEFRALCDQWRMIHGVGDDAAAEMIRDDEIDVLIDLAGHTKHDRLMLFARKPAPVQATYLGYPDTTGMSAMDYRITDERCDPPGRTEQFHREKLARVSAPFLAYEPPIVAIDPLPLPMEANGYVTFGSFNRPSKISAATIEMWAQLLKEVSRSRLIIKGLGLDEQKTRQLWLQRLHRAGIDTGRVILIGLKLDLSDHLRIVSSADILLDTFPYNGTSTTCEAMWMGVPMITRVGDAHVSRVGLSLLSSVGLTDFAAETRDQYVAKAAALANDSPRMRQLRRDLRGMLMRSPLSDADRLARDMESLMHAWVRAAT